jgi:hypothetical protein
MTFELSTIDKVNALDKFQKAKVYLHYHIAMLGVKHSFHVVDKTKHMALKQHGTPDKEFLNIAFFWLWKTFPIESSESFISENNVKLRDFGPDWKENGFAQRFSITLRGIYDWYWKHEKEFTFL